MTGTRWNEALRADLVDALRAVPPDAPTLCEGWQACHLAAHVVLRERSVRVGAGLAVPPLAGVAERAIDELAGTATTPEGYAALVDRVADAPGRWHPMTWAGDLANLVEFYVHGEDVRRGAGPVPPRELPGGVVDGLWNQARQLGRARLRTAGCGVVLVRPDGPRARLRSPRDGAGSVVVRGEVGELVLWLAGRGAAADVVAEGAEPDLAALARVAPFA
ncbi:TIGR03085 family protein [Cellulomonas sp. DKR-3]|uniref:TIGR03085 family protein n=2 Tax=Cellulomonas fulva TaxID=2835530 RepID=A0ABS5U1F1_9CELL|nr:TIGR03085 family protein [Cellulomonas fulva]